MSDASLRKIPKWPFLVGDLLLVCMAFALWFLRAPTGSLPHLALAVLCLLAGAAAGMLPFVMEYRLTARLEEAAALGTVMSQLKGIEAVAGQIRSATDNWQAIHEQSDKTAAAAKTIADRMTAEVQAFGEFMQRVNDNEKANLRLEVEKLRRAETDWLQVLVRTMDHVFALHKGAVRGGQPGVIEQLTSFQNACRETARRIGLTPFLANAGDPFDPVRHQLLQGSEAIPNGQIQETIATGYTFQGRLLRPALVRLEPQQPGPAEAQADLGLPDAAPADAVPNETKV